MESSEAKLSHPGDDFLLVVMRRSLKAVDCLEDFVVVWVAEYASQGYVLISLVCSQECALFVEIPVVESRVAMIWRRMRNSSRDGVGK